MDTNSSDIENNTRVGTITGRGGYITTGFNFTEAAALLLLWSFIVLSEGVVRFISSNPSGDLAGERMPQAILVLAAMFEVVYGLIGLFYAGAALFFKLFDLRYAKFAMFVQLVLSTFTFTIYGVIQPIFNIIDEGPGTIDGIVHREREIIMVFSLLTAASLGLALQGGQHIFFARLVAAATQTDFMKHKSGNRPRAFFWNFNMGAAGIWLIGTGGIIIESTRNNFTDRILRFGINTGSVPGMQVWTGIMLIIWGIVGELMALRKCGAPPVYYMGSVLVYVMSFLNFTLVQLGTTPNGPVGIGCANTGLVLVFTFLGPYFVHLMSKDNEQKEGNAER